MIVYSVNEDERALLEDIEEVGYGEIYNISRASADSPQVKMQISKKAKNFLVAMRILEKADRLIVHDSEPSIVEYKSTTQHGRRCKKKIKF